MQKYIYATIAQLVEHQLPKLRVAGSSPVCRSKTVNNSHIESYFFSNMMTGSSSYPL